KEGSEQLPLEGSPHIREVFDSSGRSQHGLTMPRQTHERAREAPIERARRKRRHAADLDRAVEGLVVVTEALVMRTVARLVNVEERHNEARPRIVSTHATRRLDVLGVRLRLAEYTHQPEPGDVEANRDHVG